MNLKRYLPLLLAFASLVSCKTVSYLMVDLTDPPPERLPEGIQSLTLVNRAVDHRFTDDPADSIQLRFYKSQFDIDTVIYDIKAADTLLQALGNLMFESGRFDIVIPEERFLMRDSLNAFPGNMEWQAVEKLNGTFNTDAVLSLEYFNTAVSARFGRIVTGSSGLQDYGFYDQVYVAKMGIGYTAVFSIYFPGNKTFMPSYLINDTLIWEDTNPDLKALFRTFTSVKAGLTETGIAAALNLSGKIAPKWNSYKRAYFSGGNKILLQTNNLVQKNAWISAGQLWLESLEKARSKSLRSKLEFNLALASEMQGDLDEAIRWGVQSHHTYFRTITFNYLNTLKLRKSILTPPNESNL